MFDCIFDEEYYKDDFNIKYNNVYDNILKYVDINKIKNCIKKINFFDAMYDRTV